MKNYIKVSLLTMFLVAAVFSIWYFTARPPLEVSEVSQTIDNEETKVVDNLFIAYWYADKAEIRTCHLTQSRYSELHEGKSTVIFVAQPFLKEKGVKPNNSNSTAGQVPVLKMNLLKKIGTEIYPYAMMLSTFTPLQEAQSVIKASVSGQECCGIFFSDE